MSVIPGSGRPAYAFLRRLLYGSVEDLEYVRVTVENKSSKILTLEFDSPVTGMILVGQVYRKLEGK